MTELLTPLEAARRLRMGERTLRDLKREGKIRYVALSARKIAYRAEDCDEYLRSVTVAPTSPCRELPVRVGAIPDWPAVYFLRSGRTGPIKIGTARCLANRLHALRTGHPDDLFLIAAIRGNEKDEAILHARFASDRLRGEWFAPSETLLTFLEKIDGGDR